MSHVREHFTTLLLAHFPVRAPQPAQFLKDVEEALERYSAGDLAHAAQHIIQTHDKASFPPLRTCLEAIKQFRSAPEDERPERRRRDAKQQDDPTRWNPLLESPLGVQAGHEGWIIDLLDFANKLNRLPNEREQQSLYDKARYRVEVTLADPENPFIPSLRRAWFNRTDALAAKAERKAA